MLLRYDLRSWVAKHPGGDFIDYVVASSTEEAATIVHMVLDLNEFQLSEINPLTGEEM